MHRRTVARSAVLAATLLLGGAGAARAGAPAGGVTLRLPGPTGAHRVGVTTLHLTDRSRPDPWIATIPVREVMVTVFYPARSVRPHPVAPQMTDGAAALFGAVAPLQHPELPAGGVDWSATPTHSRTEAPARSVRRPVLLYSPGGGDPRTLGTCVAEELASRGYVVVTVDHPGDACAVEFPGSTEYRGKVRPTVFRDDPRRNPGIFRTMIDTRVADLRFVLDQLGALAAGRNPDAGGRTLPERLGAVLDMRRVGLYGRSAGGTAVSQAMYEDGRVHAAVDLEGYLDHPGAEPGEAGEPFPVARHGVERPLLLVGTGGFRGRAALQRSWSVLLGRPGGRVSQHRLENAGHWVFTDYAAMTARLRAAGLMTARERTAMVGALAPAIAVPLVRDVVHGFFARHLPPHPGRR